MFGFNAVLNDIFYFLVRLKRLVPTGINANFDLGYGSTSRSTAQWGMNLVVNTKFDVNTKFEFKVRLKTISSFFHLRITNYKVF
ncbi:hypothetical protein D6U78_09395 [Vibrio cholerae]|nr:hypothetical protein [Vibrio cholerae]